MENNKRNEFTLRLIEKFVKKGMRVLDFGCGNGEITYLLANQVSSEGRVDGIDINDKVIDIAKENLNKEKYPNISFSTKTIDELDDESYDVIFGRRVLMYLENPSKTIMMLRKVLKNGGLMVFQESDEMGSLLNGNNLALHSKVSGWIWETVKREGGNIHIGSELLSLMKENDMKVIDYLSELVIHKNEEESDLAWVIAMMKARMESLGVKIETENLEEKLKEEMNQSDSFFVRDLSFGICAKKKSNKVLNAALY